MKKGNQNWKSALKAAVMVAVTGAAFIPSASCAMENYSRGYFGGDGFYYESFEGPFNWMNSDNFDWQFGIRRTTPRFSVTDDFYAYNPSVDRKYLGYYYNISQHFPNWKGASSMEATGSAWSTPTREVIQTEDPIPYSCPYEYWDRTSRYAPFQTLAQNHATLSTQSKQTLEIHMLYTGKQDEDYRRVYKSWVYYIVAEPEDSHLDFDDSGITWENNGTLLTLADKFNFGTYGLSINLDSLKIKNAADVAIGSSMTLLNDGGYYEYLPFFAKVVSSLNLSKNLAYQTNPYASIAVSGNLNLNTGLVLDGGNRIVLNALANNLGNITVDLSKIGKGETDADGNATVDQWTEGGTLYTGPQRVVSSSASLQNYSTNPLSVTIKGSVLSDAIADGSVKGGQTMKLLKLYGTHAEEITTKYAGNTITESSPYQWDTEFSDSSTAGIVAAGARTDTLHVSHDASTGFLEQYKIGYNLNYTVGYKNISSFTGDAAGIDLSKTSGGFVADDGYQLDSDITINVGDSAWKWLNRDKAQSLTLIDVSQALGDGKLLVQSDAEGTAGSEATIIGDSYTAYNDNGVGLIGTKNDLLFTVDSTGKTLTVSGFSSPTIRQLWLSQNDISKGAYVSPNVAETGLVLADENLLLTGVTLGDVAKKQNYTLVKAGDDSRYNFANWTFFSGKGGTTFYVEPETGVKATLNAVFDTGDGNINVSSTGLRTLSFGQGIQWENGRNVATFGNGIGTVDYAWTIDFSDISFTGADDDATETMHLIAPTSLVERNGMGSVTITKPDDWKAEASGYTTTYTGNIGQTSISGNGLTLGMETQDKVVLTKFPRAYWEDKVKTYTQYDFSMDYVRNENLPILLVWQMVSRGKTERRRSNSARSSIFPRWQTGPSNLTEISPISLPIRIKSAKGKA